MLPLQLQPPGRDLGTKPLGAGQHPARKNIGLNELGAVAITLEALIFNTDDLQYRTASGLEAAFELIEVNGPVLFTHRLKHLDRHDMIIDFSDITVIGKGKPTQFVQTGPFNTLAGIVKLLV